MPTPALKLSRLSFVGLAKEVTQGTYLAPTFYIPGVAYKPEDVFARDDVTTLQGNAAKLQGSVDGVHDSIFGLDTLLFWEAIGPLLVAQGYADTVTAPRSVADGADTTSTTITSATAAFTQGDVGAAITGTDIPASTTIASVTNATTAVLSQATTGTGAARTWVIGSGRSVTDGVTNTTTTLTSATAAFTAADVGAAVTDQTNADIPAGTTIASVTNGTTVIMSQAATGSHTVQTIVIASAVRHNFKIPALGTQPPSYSVTDFNQLTAATGTRGWPGQLLDQLDFTIDAGALIKVATQWKGWPSGSQAKPTPTYPVLNPGHGWEATVQIGSGARLNVQSMGYTLKRNVEAEHTAQNTQVPYVMFAGEAEATGKMLVLALDETELGYYLNNTQGSIVTVITAPAGTPAPSLTIRQTSTVFKKGPIDRSGPKITLPLDFEGMYSAADAGPAQFTLQNGIAAAY